MALEVIGGSLRHQPFEIWDNMKERLQSQSILELQSQSNPEYISTNLLSRLQQSLDILEDKFSVKCFMDLGLFPEDQRIPVATLIDIWAELHNLDENGRKAMTIIHDLTTRNLIKLIETRYTTSFILLLVGHLMLDLLI